MSEIKLFVTHTPNRNTVRIEHPLMYNVIAGSAFLTQSVPEGMLLDNEGDNISFKNKSYCELTTQYWAWKNQTADYYGFCHYRRYFSFSKVNLQEADCGCLIYPVLSENVKQELCMDEASMRQTIEQYDFLIAKGIPVNALQAKSVYQHYKNAPELHIEDLDLFLSIIREKYPELNDVAEKYVHGKIFYPCNMFIMNKELFFQYSKMLFDILDEFEQRCDMSRYSREGLRTPGHLGERMTGIFFEYLKQKGGYRLGQLQMAQIEQNEGTSKISVSEDDEIPVVLAANQGYVPILYTCLQSIADHISEQRDYKIYIFHTDIESESQNEIRKLKKKNFDVSFVNVRSRVAGYQLKAKEHISTETFYRFLILDILKMYPKVVYLDCDMIIRRDIAELYDVKLGDNMLAAVIDPDFAGQCNGANADTLAYCRDVLKLKDPLAYFQAGVLVFHMGQIADKISVQKLFEMSDTGIYKYSDQDILNIVCEGKVTYLNMQWNVLTDCNKYRWQHVIKSAPYYVMDAYENARKDPYIIHYAGAAKPWKNPKDDFAKEFWKVARRTPYYEELIYDLCGQEKRKGNPGTAVVNVMRKTAKKILPQGSWIRRTVGNLYWKLK